VKIPKALRRPTVVLALVFVALAAASGVVYVVADALDDWMPNLATEALSLAATVLVVEWVLKREARARLQPWTERVFGDIGLDFWLIMQSVLIDYAATHIETYRPVPRDAVEMLDHWLAESKREDEPRRIFGDEGETRPALLIAGIEFAQRLRWYRDADATALEPEFVRAIDDFVHGVSLTARLFPYPDSYERPEAERVASSGVVERLKTFAELFRRYAPRTMEIEEQAVRAIEAHRNHYLRRRQEQRAET
jgi:hypothetical protein